MASIRDSTVSPQPIVHAMRPTLLPFKGVAHKLRMDVSGESVLSDHWSALRPDELAAVAGNKVEDLIHFIWIGAADLPA